MSHQKEVKRRNTFKRTNIGKLIDALCKTRDLIQFTKGVNKMSEKLGINQFEMSNQQIVLLKDNLDKSIIWEVNAEKEYHEEKK